MGRHDEFAPANAGDIANLACILGEERLAVVDTGGSEAVGRALLAAIRERTGLPVGYVVNTHHHPDHVFGNGAFKDTGAHFVGHARLPDALARRGPLYRDNLQRLMGEAAGDLAIVPPDMTVPVGEALALDLGGRVLRLRAWPTAHTDTDLTVLDETTGTLIAGDLLFMERLPVVDGSLNGWLGTLDALAATPAARVVPGHGPARADWPAALGRQRAYLEELRDRVRVLIAQGVPMGEAVDRVPPPAGWELTADNHARNVIAAFQELEWE